MSAERPPRLPEGPEIRKVLLTGATGFVGSYLYPALIAGGYHVRCASRKPAKAEKRYPDREWVELDLERPETLGPAMQGCDAAFYLVHGMGGGAGYPAREARQAQAFREAAREAGVKRIVYLGGVEPQGAPSRHLKSRLDTGRILRAGDVSTVELRAAMILGAGSSSWRMVSDLAARLPAMILPKWLMNRSWPVAIDDVVVALLVALRLPDGQAGCYDVPGPEGLSHRLVLERVAAQLGAHPPMWNVPVLTPRLSSYWVMLVTRVDRHLAKELVQGLQYNLDPTCQLIWEHVPGHRRMSLEEAGAHALHDERSKTIPSQRAREMMERLGHTFRRKDPDA